MIEIYGTSRCGFCDQAKELAEKYNLDYVYKDASDLDIYQTLIERVGNFETVPQIFWHGKHIGGYDSFAAEVQNTREFGQDGF
jgi:glutaredoxin|tara:strand:- start:2236 stop:2484 length:249 start_codon:yes stop_codon:yes gene_type:complete